jgi:predicted transcriptional regulator
MNHPMSQHEKQAAYDAWFVAEVEKGLADVDAGNVLTETEAAAHMEKFFDSLAKESSQAA